MMATSRTQLAGWGGDLPAAVLRVLRVGRKDVAMWMVGQQAQ